MSHSFRLILPLCAAAAIVSAWAQQVQAPEMTARELFYNAGADPAAASKTSAAKAPAKVVVAKKRSAAPVMQQASNRPPAQPAQPPAAQTMAAPAPSTPASGAKIIGVSDTVRSTAPPPASGIALGLKYTILKLIGSAMAPVAPSTVFHAGDKIQFSIETNTPGYLYIITQGSSGTWKPVFPSPEIEGGDNRVEGFHTYTFPQGYRYVFDQQAGDEKLFIIFSRVPKSDFEEMVYSLQGGQKAPVSEPKPGAQAQPAHVMRASIDDTTVGRLHEAYSRDLIIEKVGDDTHAAQDDAQEKAVYVVNPTGSADSALVADLHLVHQ